MENNPFSATQGPVEGLVFLGVGVVSGGVVYDGCEPENREGFPPKSSTF